MKHLAVSRILALGMVALLSCSRDQSPDQAANGPITKVVLPTNAPRGVAPRLEVASTASPAAAPSAPPTVAVRPTVVAAVAPMPAAATSPAVAAATSTPALVATAMRATPTPATASAVSPSPAAEVVRAGTVDKGVDIRVGPAADARVRGTFGGRTAVQVLREEGDWSFVRAPVVSGGAVEGWVASSAVHGAAEKVAKSTKASGGAPTAPAAPPPPAPRAASGTAVKESADAQTGAGSAAKAAPAPKAAPTPAAKAAPAPAPAPKAAPAHGGGDKGPDSIVLKAIVGTEEKKPPVPFTHKAHRTEDKIDCISCHHVVKARGNVEAPSHKCTDSGCHGATQCNNQQVAKENEACPMFEDAFHTNCIECHKKKSGPTKCKECHTG